MVWVLGRYDSSSVTSCQRPVSGRRECVPLTDLSASTGESLTHRAALFLRDEELLTPFERLTADVLAHDVAFVAHAQSAWLGFPDGVGFVSHVSLLTAGLGLCRSWGKRRRTLPYVRKIKTHTLKGLGFTFKLSVLLYSWIRTMTCNHTSLRIETEAALGLCLGFNIFSLVQIAFNMSLNLFSSYNGSLPQIILAKLSATAL